MELSHESMHDQIASWMYNLDLFKNKCKHKLDTSNNGDVDNDENVKNKKANIDMEKKALAAEAAMMMDPTREIKSKFREI